MALLASGAAELQGQEPFPAWVALYGAAPLARLDNEYRIDSLCASQAGSSDCYHEQMSPTVSFTSLHVEPDVSSRRVGELVLVVTPGHGLSVYFRPTDPSGAQVFFTPDLFLQDWGYGVFFHQTIAERRGDWFKLPRRPWASPVWLHVPRAEGSDPVVSVQPGDIIEMEGSGWYVVGSTRDQLVLRAEQLGDMWCFEGDPPPVREVEPTRFSRAELLDPDGHLVFRPKYLKGC